MIEFMNDQNNALQSSSINLASLSVASWVETLTISQRSSLHLMVFTCASFATPAVFDAVVAAMKLAVLPRLSYVFTQMKDFISTILKICESNSKAATGLLAVGETAEAVAMGGNVAKTGFRAISPAFAALGGVFVAIDITSTIIQNHCVEHVTIDKLDDIAPFINAISEEMRQILKELEDFLALGA